jgi:hypothetical protein
MANGARHNADNGFCVLRVKARGHRELMSRAMSGREVDLILDRLAAEEAVNVAEEERHFLDEGVARAGTDVRSEDDVAHLGERGGTWGLGFEDVEAGTAQMAAA